MPPSRLDHIYRRLLITRFFEKGWGKPENLQRLFEFRKIMSRRETCFKLVPPDYPIEITKKANYPDCTILEGNFKTPFEFHLPGLVPKASQKAHFQVILPTKWADEKHKPMCIHLAGTGDHFYWRRRNFIAKPLLREANIGGIILENPFYGLRKPENQVRSNLRNVSDIFVMGGCLILECLVLLHWCERNGYGPLGITGMSMGGHMASLAATNWPKPLVLVPCLSWSTASAVFTTGVMSHSINWDMLETQYFADGIYRERLSKMVTIIDDAFAAGKKFIKDFSQSMNELKEDIKDVKLMKDDLNIKSPVDENNEFKFIESSGFLRVNKENTHDLNKQLQGKSMSANKYEISNLTEAEANAPNKKSKITKSDDDNDENVSEIKDLDIYKKNFKQPSSSSPLTKLMDYIYPRATQETNEKIDITKTNWWEREALQFMRGVMDECTHLKNFSVPIDTSLIIAICAKNDAYVPREGCSSLEEIWPGVEVRYLNAGHVSAYILHQKLFRSSIIEAFERAKKKSEEQNAELALSDDIKPTITYDELQKKYEKHMFS
ncbi:protein ABHD18 [Episyrphus balteatus]|uniref:protein ABHD18 n=1 Tax=Episyrphus balteatus TaxID=286459 RepID=UPI002485CB23|nr:protein ABHD18 [Episyrphus balteatus]XP_055855783.1 protein ABHD18 [Episyrphus balteatus]XP_055855784.1 protein ABHD18 [Episyrphus balteatus]